MKSNNDGNYVASIIQKFFQLCKTPQGDWATLKSKSNYKT